MIGRDQPRPIGAGLRPGHGPSRMMFDLRDERATAEPEVGLEPSPGHPCGIELDRVCPGGHGALRKGNQSPTDLGSKPDGAGDQDALRQRADGSIGLGCEEPWKRRMPARSRAGSLEADQAASLDLRTRRRDELAAIEHEVAVLDTDQRLDRRTFVGPEPEIREHQRPAAELEQGAARGVGLRRPGEPFRVLLRRRIDPDLERQAIGKPDRRALPGARADHAHLDMIHASGRLFPQEGPQVAMPLARVGVEDQFIARARPRRPGPGACPSSETKRLLSHPEQVVRNVRSRHGPSGGTGGEARTTGIGELGERERPERLGAEEGSRSAPLAEARRLARGRTE